MESLSSHTPTCGLIDPVPTETHDCTLKKTRLMPSSGGSPVLEAEESLVIVKTDLQVSDRIDDHGVAYSDDYGGPLGHAGQRSKRYSRKWNPLTEDEIEAALAKAFDWCR